MTKPNPTPKPTQPKKKPELASEGAIFDAVLDDSTVEQHTELNDSIEVVVEEVVAEPEAIEEVVVVEEPKPVIKNSSSSAPPSEYAVVSNEDKDVVSVAKAIYKNIYQKKSLTVHHIQRRLNEWGYKEAFLDKDGFYGDLTKSAMEQFQSDHGLNITGLADYDTFVVLFENDNNVRVVR
jgi:hypothetical protein